MGGGVTMLSRMTDEGGQVSLNRLTYSRALHSAQWQRLLGESHILTAVHWSANRETVGRADWWMKSTTRVVHRGGFAFKGGHH